MRPFFSHSKSDVKGSGWYSELDLRLEGIWNLFAFPLAYVPLLSTFLLSPSIFVRGKWRVAKKRILALRKSDTQREITSSSLSFSIRVWGKNNNGNHRAHPFFIRPPPLSNVSFSTSHSDSAWLSVSRFRRSFFARGAVERSLSPHLRFIS